MRRRVLRSESETHGATPRSVSNRFDTKRMRELKEGEQKKSKKKLTKVKQRYPLRLVDKVEVLTEQTYLAQREALNLKMMGNNVFEIAEKMGRMVHDIRPLLEGALEELKEDRQKAVDRFVTLTNARYEKLQSILWPLVEGKTEKVLDENGKEVVVHTPTDKDAARILAKVIHDQAKVNGLHKTKVEISGKDGEEIRFKVDIGSLSAEQLKKLSEGDRSVIDFMRGAGGGYLPPTSRTG